MIRRDHPGSIGLALDAAGDAADRLQPAHMGFGKTRAGGRIVSEVDIDVIPSTAGSRDFGHHALDLPRLGGLGLDTPRVAYVSWADHLLTPDDANEGVAGPNGTAM